MIIKDFEIKKKKCIEKCNDDILKNFKKLGVKDQLLYDFTTGYNDNYDKIENAIEKLLKYRVVVLKKKSETALKENWFDKYKGLIDPDSNSLLLRIFYYKLWGKNTYITGDTMTSAATPINQFLKLFFNDHLKENPNPRGWTTVYCANNYEYLKKHIKADNEYKDVYNFILLNHTLGNFIPVPEGFNVPRSNKGKDDNWFLTISKIKEYLDNGRNKQALNELLHNNDITTTEIWLQSYESYKSFEEKNYLQDYSVNIIDDFDWKKHKINKNNWKNFFETMNKVILLRTLRMLIRINDDKAKKDECKELMKKIQKDGYRKVLEELTK